MWYVQNEYLPVFSNFLVIILNVQKKIKFKFVYKKWNLWSTPDLNKVNFYSFDIYFFFKLYWRLKLFNVIFVINYNNDAIILKYDSFLY